MHSNHNLMTIAHIPIQLQIVCALWQKGEKEFPQTLSLLFSKITHHLYQWERQKKGGNVKSAISRTFISLIKLLARSL